jgi:hypothetical protein
MPKARKKFNTTRVTELELVTRPGVMLGHNPPHSLLMVECAFRAAKWKLHKLHNLTPCLTSDHARSECGDCVVDGHRIVAYISARMSDHAPGHPTPEHLEECYTLAFQLYHDAQAVALYQESEDSVNAYRKIVDDMNVPRIDPDDLDDLPYEPEFLCDHVRF